MKKISRPKTTQKIKIVINQNINTIRNDEIPHISGIQLLGTMPLLRKS